MEITKVRVALCESPARPGATEGRSGEKRLKAYATLTFDRCFVVRNIKIIDGRNGLFVAMPSHKPKVVCGTCQFKNDLGGRFCAQCGSPVSRAVDGAAGAVKSGSMDNPAHRDIAHPITVEFRQYLQQKVLEAYETERAKSRSHPSPTVEANGAAV